MSDDAEYDENGNPVEAPEESSVIKRFRKERDDALKELKSLRPVARENAILKSGVDVTSREGRMFAEMYQGEPSAEAVKAEALKYGLIASPSETPEYQEEAAAIQRTQAAAYGGDIAASGAINAAVLWDWSKEKRAGFKSKYPVEYERVKQGATVTGIAF